MAAKTHNILQTNFAPSRVTNSTNNCNEKTLSNLSYCLSMSIKAKRNICILCQSKFRHICFTCDEWSNRASHLQKMTLENGKEFQSLIFLMCKAKFDSLVINDVIKLYSNSIRGILDIHWTFANVSLKLRNSLAKLWIEFSLTNSVDVSIRKTHIAELIQSFS